MARDRAGDSLEQAKNLGLIGSKPGIFQDSVSKSDLNDLYRVKIGSRSSFKLNIDNLDKDTKLDVEIFTLKSSAQKVLKAIGRTDFGKLKAKDLAKNLEVVARSVFSRGSNSIVRTLDSDEYYLRITPRKGSTSYKVSVAASPLAIAPPTNTPNTPGKTTTPTSTPSAPIVPIAPPPAAIPVQLGQKWLRQFGTASNDYAYGVAVVGDNLYLSGSTEGGLDGTNKGSRDSFAALYKTDGTAQWMRQFGAAGRDIGTGIAADSAGNYYVSGADVSTGTVPDPNGYVTKYDSTGVKQWRLDVKGTLSAEAIAAVVADSAGNTYAAGFSGGTPGFAPAKVYISKYDTTNKKVWATSYLLSQSSAATSVAIDASGNVYVAGITNAVLNADVNAPFTGGDVFFSKFSSAGKKLWDKTIASAGAEYARGIAVDPSGNVYITGQTDGTLPGQTSAGGIDSFVAKYDTNGNQQWLNQFGTAALDEGQGIVYSNGNVYLTGETAGGIFGNANLGGSDAWLAAFDSYGRLVGSTQIGTNKDDETYNITSDTTGNLYLVGQTYGAFTGATNQGQYDVWTAKYTVA
jgi:Beta-propeller repeat